MSLEFAAPGYSSRMELIAEEMRRSDLPQRLALLKRIRRTFSPEIYDSIERAAIATASAATPWPDLPDAL
jgi:hypothetical protein